MSPPQLSYPRRKDSPHRTCWCHCRPDGYLIEGQEGGGTLLPQPLSLILIDPIKDPSRLNYK